MKESIILRKELEKKFNLLKIKNLEKINWLVF